MYAYLDIRKPINKVYTLTGYGFQLIKGSLINEGDTYLNDYSPFVIKSSEDGTLILTWQTWCGPLTQIIT